MRIQDRLCGAYSRARDRLHAPNGDTRERQLAAVAAGITAAAVLLCTYPGLSTASW